MDTSVLDEKEIPQAERYLPKRKGPVIDISAGTEDKPSSLDVYVDVHQRDNLPRVRVFVRPRVESVEEFLYTAMI